MSSLQIEPAQHTPHWESPHPACLEVLVSPPAPTRRPHFGLFTAVVGLYVAALVFWTWALTAIPSPEEGSLAAVVLAVAVLFFFFAPLVATLILIIIGAHEFRRRGRERRHMA